MPPFGSKRAVEHRESSASPWCRELPRLPPPAVRSPKRLFPVCLSTFTDTHSHHAYHSGAIHLPQICDSAYRGYEPATQGAAVLVNPGGDSPPGADRLCQVSQLFPSADSL